MTYNKLDKIEIENFKSIRKLELDLDNLNIFIGPNGAGKSNFIDIFEFLNEIINKRLQIYTGKAGGADKILYYGKKIAEFLRIKLSFSDFEYDYEIKLLPTQENVFIFEKEEIADKKDINADSPQTSRRINFGNGYCESRLKENSEKKLEDPKYVYSVLESWKIYHFHDTSDNSLLKQLCDLEDNILLKPDARNIAAFLYRIKEKYPDYYNNIEDTIKSVVPFFENLRLVPSRLNEKKIGLEWKEKGNDNYFNAHSLSDGTLRFICLATLLMQPDELLPSVIILDEPELGLHPYAIQVLAGLLKSVSQKTQVLVSTQSVTLVNQFDPENIIVVDREDSQSVFKRLDKSGMENWLEDYGLGDLWEKNIFGGRP